MSVITRMVAPVEDRWPSDRTPAADPLEEVLFASHLLGSNRALATTAAATRRPKAPPPTTSAAR